MPQTIVVLSVASSPRPNTIPQGSRRVLFFYWEIVLTDCARSPSCEMYTTVFARIFTVSPYILVHFYEIPYSSTRALRNLNYHPSHFQMNSDAKEIANSTTLVSDLTNIINEIIIYKH